MNEILKEYYDVRDKHDAALGELETATQRIINVIKKVFKMGKDAWWSFDYYSDADDDSPLPQPLEEKGTVFHIHINGEADSGEWYYNNAFPVSFFDMTDQEIETHIKEEIKQSTAKEDVEAERQRKIAETRAAKKNALKATAAKKLTKEERKALGL